MGTVIGEFLPLAVGGVAISPIPPVVAAILMLLSTNAGSTSTGFGLGWVVGIFAATGIVALLSGGAFDTSDSDGSSGSVSWIKVASVCCWWRWRPNSGAIAATRRSRNGCRRSIG